MILFSVRGQCGYPLRDALRKVYTGLEGRDDKVFIGFDRYISIRLEVRITRRKGPTVTLNPVISGCRTRGGRSRSLPTPSFHYGVIDHSPQIRTLTWNKPPDNITRAKLATEVAKRMVIFFEVTPFVWLPW